MNRLRYYLLVLAIGCNAWAQRADKTPLGVLITPPRALQVSKELKAVLPKNATVRLVQSTSMEAPGEQVVIYERGSEYEPHSHLAIVKNGVRVADFSLTKLFRREGIGETYAFFQGSEFKTAENRNAFVAAFRNIGDGSGTLFLLVTQEAEHYSAWKRATVQGKFKVLRSGEIQIWDAADVPDGAVDCVWCARYYTVSTFRWTNGTPTRTSRFRTRNALDPESISNKAIVVENSR